MVRLLRLKHSWLLGECVKREWSVPLARCFAPHTSELTHTYTLTHLQTHTPTVSHKLPLSSHSQLVISSPLSHFSHSPVFFFQLPGFKRRCAVSFVLSLSLPLQLPPAAPFEFQEFQEYALQEQQETRHPCRDTGSDCSHPWLLSRQLGGCLATTSFIVIVIVSAVSVVRAICIDFDMQGDSSYRHVDDTSYKSTTVSRGADKIRSMGCRTWLLKIKTGHYSGSTGKTSGGSRRAYLSACLHPSFAASLKWILQQEGFTVEHYVDDFLLLLLESLTESQAE